jgi:hypothetical protein
MLFVTFDDLLLNLSRSSETAFNQSGEYRFVDNVKRVPILMIGHNSVIFLLKY